MLLIFGLLFLAGPKLFHQWRPTLSYWLKHVPLYIAENIGLLPPSRAKYVRELETTVDIIYCTPAKPPKLLSGPLANELIVASDMGGVVQRINAEGRLVWQRSFWSPRSLEIQAGRIFVAEGRYLHVLSLATGATLQEFEFNNPIIAIRLEGNALYTLMDNEGKGLLSKYEFSINKFNLVKSVLIEKSYPRGFDIDSLNIYIADTYGHRILLIDRDTFEVQDSVPSYFPNSIQVIGDHLIVTEEHSNVISRFAVRPLVRRDILVGCPSFLLGVKNKKNALMEPIQKSTCDPKLFPIYLYSPNNAYLKNENLYIADTDNHRVIQLTACKIDAELTGFNDPVCVRPVPR